jgi:hypothetical protein
MAPKWELTLRATNKAAKTIKSYLEALHLLCLFLARHRLPDTDEAIARAHVEAFIADQLRRLKPDSVATLRSRRLCGSCSPSVHNDRRCAGLGGYHIWQRLQIV